MEIQKRRTLVPVNLTLFLNSWLGGKGMPFGSWKLPNVKVRTSFLIPLLIRYMLINRDLKRKKGVSISVFFLFFFFF